MDAQTGMLAQPLEHPMGLGEEWEVYSGVVRVGIGDTARRRGQSYASIMADPDGRRVVTVTEDRDDGLVGRPCSEPGGTEATGRGPPRPRATWPKHTSSARS